MIPDYVSRPVWARIKALDSEFRTRINQEVARDSVVCEALQKCFDILVEDQLDRGRSLPSKRFVGQSRIRSLL